MDVVVADEMIALDFARRHREEIWPGATIVFNSVPAAALPGLALEPDTIGIPLRLELEATLDLALKLRPEAKRIAVVAGNADQDLKLLSLARAALERRGERLDVQYLVGLAVPDTVAAIQTLPPDAAILYLTVFRDGTGAPQVPRDVLTRIAAASRAPLFGMFETYLGDGIAAGSIAGHATQGRLSGELAARVLNGEDPAAIRVQAPEPAAPNSRRCRG